MSDNSGDQVLKVSPFQGLPTTIDSVENGVPTITVIAVDTEPFRMKVAMFVIFAVIGMIAVAAGTMYDHVVDTTFFRVNAWGAFLCTFIGMALYARYPVFIRFTPTQLMVRRGLLERSWSVFDLSHPHSIGMIIHDKAMQEKLGNEYRKDSAARNGTAVKPEVVYGDSYHICFSYFGQRHDLLTVQGRKDAARITSRLQACLDINRARAGKGGSATKPAQQWAASSGRVPQ